VGAIAVVMIMIMRIKRTTKKKIIEAINIKILKVTINLLVEVAFFLHTYLIDL